MWVESKCSIVMPPSIVSMQYFQWFRGLLWGFIWDIIGCGSVDLEKICRSSILNSILNGISQNNRSFEYPQTVQLHSPQILKAFESTLQCHLMPTQWLSQSRRKM